MKIKTTPLSNFDIDESILAHSPNETLKEHSNLTISYTQKIIKEKNLESILEHLFKKIDSKNDELIKQMFFDAIYLHDLGKTNPNFQAKKMNNPKFKAYLNSSESSNHSDLSAIMYIELYKGLLKDFKRVERYRLIFVLYSFAYAISKHHGSLSVFEEYKSEDKDVKNYQTYLDRLDVPYFEFYILNKLLFSLLISSDYYATTEYMADFKCEDFGVFDKQKKDELQNLFQTYIESFEEPKGINILRDKIAKEAKKTLLEHLDKHIYYLEAPTGSGKTLTSISLALSLLQADDKLNKLFYIFPFNTLVEQTKGVFDEIFADKLDIATINSITPLEIKDQEDEESKYTASYINRLFFHSPAIITTHVSLFNIFFGTSKEDNFPLWQLANSVVIIDEIQSYNNKLWWYMVEFFDKYALLLNIKIIIMSATLPKIDYFLEKKDNFVDLIIKEKRDEFFKHKYFKDRVKADFSLLNDGKIKIDKLFEFFKEVKQDNKKILFEFIKKQRAREFYELLTDSYEEVCELSGDDNKAYRQYVINKVNNTKKPIIVVATQVIEAGVDIDMDLGFKDISTLDSEEQFIGRINRSCERSGKVYFFDMDDASAVYRGDNRLGFDLTNPKYQKILQEKNYHEYYANVLEVIKKDGLRFKSGVDTKIDNFTGLIKKLNYKEIKKEMRLISSDSITLYFPFMIDLSIYHDIKEFNDNRVKEYLTDGRLDGQKVWEAFERLNEIEEFAKQQYEHSYINSLMQFFTFNLIKYKEAQKPNFYSYEFKGYFYIQNHEDFIKDGKFDRMAFEKYSGGMFL